VKDKAAGEVKDKAAGRTKQPPGEEEAVRKSAMVSWRCSRINKVRGIHGCIF